MYNAPYQGVANNLAQYGRYGDSQLVHMNPIEVQMLSRLSPIGLTTNPMTGQKEAFLPFLLPLLGSFAGKAALGATLGTAFGSAALGTAAAGAIGSGLTTAAITGDLEQGIMAGITGFGIGSALGGLGAALPDAATTAAAAGTEAATQAGTEVATQAAADTTAQLAAEVPQIGEGFGSAINPIADIGSQAAPDILGGFGEGFGSSMSPDAFSPAARTLPSAPTFGSQTGQFISNLAKPSSFLPVYVGETGREARRQEIAGEGSARDYEAKEEAERNRIRGQMSSVFDQVRRAYPGVGYAAGGMVERYAEGGFNIDQDLINSLRFSGLPVAENVQLSLRGSEFVPPPASSYSALDVGGEGYLAGVAPEFQYFRAPPPLPGETPPGGTPPGGTPPGGPDFNQPVMGPGYGGFLDEYLSNYSGGPGSGDMDMPVYAGGSPNFDFTGGMPDYTPAYTGGTPNFDFTGGMPDYTPAYTGGTPNFDEGGFNSSIMEELLNSQFNPIQDNFSAIETQPSVPDFDYSRIPAYTPPDFSGIEDGLISSPMPQFDMPPTQQQITDLQSGIGSLQSNPQPSFDLSGLEQQLAFMQSLESPQVGFDPTMEQLSSLESLLASQRPEPYQDMSSFQNPFDEFSMSDGFAEGGMTGMDNQSQMGDANSIVEMTVAAIRGEIENADQIISRFVEMYGPEVFTQLRERVLQDIVPGAQTNGMVEGEGGGQDDLVEGMIGTQRPVAVSPGEYIIPADVVSLAGGGYSGNGASFFDSLVDDIRQKTMGTTKQVRPYQRSA